MGKKARRGESLGVMREHVAGADIGSREHWVAGPPHPDGSPNVRTFRTTTKELNQLADWLLEEGIESIAMESTSVYWIPVYELLEGRGIEVVLVNAHHLKGVPGRKTDMLDCQWLQRLHSCGLLNASFRPAEWITALRALMRQCGNLVRARTRAIQWMQKALDQMNVQVHHAVTDLTGKTGMAIVRAIVGGEREPMHLAALRDRRCKKSEDEIAELLTGTWREEHLFNLRMALEHFDHLNDQIAAYETRLITEIKALQIPELADKDVPAHPKAAKGRALRARGEQQLREELWRFAGVDLTRIDGLSATTSLIILTEVGYDLSEFPTEKHFVSWLRLAPRQNFSAGKPVRKKKNGMGSNRIAGALRLAARALVRSRSALGAALRKKAYRKGKKIAIFATARRLAILVYRMLRYGEDYVDVGETVYEERFRQRRLKGMHAAAKRLGYTLTPIPEPT